MRLPHIDGATQKIVRASQHIGELERVLNEYGRRLSISYQPVEGDPAHKRLTFSEATPPEIPLIVGDVIHNLRSALDILVVDLARRRGVTDEDKLRRVCFPFATRKTDLKTAAKNALSEVGQDVIDAILEMPNYPKDYEILKGLHDLDVYDKHHYVLPLLGCSWGKSFEEVLADKLSKAFEKNVVASGGTPSLDLEGSLIRTEDADLHFDASYRPSRPATALFPDGHPLARRHILPTLVEMSEVTGAIVRHFNDTFGTRMSKAEIAEWLAATSEPSAKDSTPEK